MICPYCTVNGRGWLRSIDSLFDEETYRAALAGIDADLTQFESVERASVTFRLGINWERPA